MDTTALPPPSPKEKLTPGTAIGHYRVEELISSGGFGAVYRVSRDGKPFALKLPLARSGPEASQHLEDRRTTEARIQREVVALMTLKHPNIVRVHAFDRWPSSETGALYLVMDFVDGQPMTKWRETSGCTLRQLVVAFHQLALAIHEMHAMGVVHRDIKSSNVLGRADGSPVLVDFGLARPTYTSDVTAEHVLVGTEGRWAPELLATSGPHFHYTPATDLYALGHLFSEVLNGASHLRRAGAKLLPPDGGTTGILRSLHALELHLTASRPEERTPSARVLVDKLEEILDDVSWGQALPPAREPTAALHLATVPPTAPMPGAQRRTPRPPTRTQQPDPTAPIRPTRGIPTAQKERPPSPRLMGDLAEQPSAAADRAPQPEFAPPKAEAPPTAATSLKGAAHGSQPKKAQSIVHKVLWMIVAVGVIGKLATGLADSTRAPTPKVAVLSSFDAGTAPPPAPASAKPPKPRLVSPNIAPRPSVPPAQQRESTQRRAMVRAALIGHARPGPTHAVLRQPVLLAATSLPTGVTLDGTADELPDGRFLLRFAAVRWPDGSVLPLNATALVDAAAAERHPLRPGVAPPAFEFDLTLTSVGGPSD